MNNLKEKIIFWWEGQLQEESLEEIFSDPPVDTYKHHWSAVIARVLVTFYLKHWKWFWGFCLSLVGLYIAYLKL